MHDYYALDESWHANMLSYDEDYDILMNSILDRDGNRYHDWTLDNECHPYFKLNPYQIFLPYEISDAVRYQYISGGYWIAKKIFMCKYLLRENLGWGMAEDIEWSRRALKTANLKLNSSAEVHLIKDRNATNYKVICDEQILFLKKLIKKIQ